MLAETDNQTCKILIIEKRFALESYSKSRYKKVQFLENLKKYLIFIFVFFLQTESND